MRYTYRDSKEFKTEKLVEYFTDKKRVDVTDKNYESAIKLDKMIFIYNQDIDTLNKYYQMSLLFKNAGEFSKEYKFLKDFLHESTVYYLDLYVEEIIIFLNKIERGLEKETLKNYLKLEKNNYFDDYSYAEYFVKEYIEYDESPFLRDFLNEFGIQENDFIRFTNIVFELNEELYNKYLEKFNLNRLIRKNETINGITNIREGIINGYTKDNTEFDFVEFFANIPFYDLDSSKEIVEDFELKKMPTVDKRFRSLLEALYPNDSKDIMTYVYANKLLSINPATISEKNIMSISYIINDKPLLDSEKEEIIAKMKERKIPFLQRAFTEVKNKYLAEGLNKEDIKVLKK